ncbi:MAG: type II toxin-antitoxin system VapC family toxin [Rhizomicrobium sp.]
MRLLLDSHILMAILRRNVRTTGAAIARLLDDAGNEKIASSASFWEMAIKHRLSKLALPIPLASLPAYFAALEYTLLPVTPFHAVEDLDDPPPTRDPFDRLLLAQCQVEGLRFVTVDRALIGHPLAWRGP